MSAAKAKIETETKDNNSRMKNALESATNTPQSLIINEYAGAHKTTRWRLEELLLRPYGDCIGHKASVKQLHEGRDTFADWTFVPSSEEGQAGQLAINLHIDNNDENSHIEMEISLGKKIEEIAQLVAGQLESEAIHPVHAKAIFAAVAMFHARAAQDILRMDGGLQSLDTLLAVKKNDQHTSEGRHELESKYALMNKVAPHLKAAAEAMGFEEATHKEISAKAAADAINAKLAAQERAVG